MNRKKGKTKTKEDERKGEERYEDRKAGRPERNRKIDIDEGRKTG
jgi:hypothetical protein